MSHSSSFSKTRLESLFDRMQTGDEQAFAQFWDEHYECLLRLARRKIGGVPLKDADSEDIAICALNSFFRGVSEKRFPDVTEAKKLWNLLATLVTRKLSHHREKQLALKRGAGRIRGESVFMRKDESAGMDMIPDEADSPEADLEFLETSEHLFDLLEDDSLRNVARWTFEGYTNREMAEKLGCTIRSIERKLQRIRTLWSEAIAFWESDDG